MGLLAGRFQLLVCEIGQRSHLTRTLLSKMRLPSFLASGVRSHKLTETLAGPRPLPYGKKCSGEAARACLYSTNSLFAPAVKRLFLFFGFCTLCRGRTTFSPKRRERERERERCGFSSSSFNEVRWSGVGGAASAAQ